VVKTIRPQRNKGVDLQININNIKYISKTTKIRIKDIIYAVQTYHVEEVHVCSKPVQQ